MSFFANLSEIITSLSPRRPRRQPDHQRSDADTLGHLHSPLRASRSPSLRASHRVSTPRNEIFLGSDLEDTLSEPRLSPRNTVRSQVCDAPRYMPSSMAELAFSFSSLGVQCSSSSVEIYFPLSFFYATIHLSFPTLQLTTTRLLRVMPTTSTPPLDLELPADNCGPHLRSSS